MGEFAQSESRAPSKAALARKRRFTRWTCGLLLVATSLIGQDVLILRNGEARTGVLQSCLEDRCQFGGSSVPRNDIAWIGFAQEKAAPNPIPSRADDQVVLRDGTTHAGKVVGVSLGVVVLGKATLDRSQVGWIRFGDPTAAESTSDPAPAAPMKPDAVAFRDGSVAIGELVACVGGTCFMEGVGSLAREDIATIVFGAGAAAEPSAGSTASDEDVIILGTLGTREGTVLAIDPETVYSAAGNFSRASVTGVVFADSRTAPALAGAESPGAPPPAPEAPAGQAPLGRPPVPTPAPGPSPAPPPPLPPGGATSSPTGPRPGLTRGALWTGTCEGTFKGTDDNCVWTLTFSADLRLREWVRTIYSLDSELTAIGRRGELEPEGTVLRNAYELDCGDAGGASGSGTISLSTEPDQPGSDHGGGDIYYKTREYDFTPFVGIDIPVGDTLYHLGLSIPQDDEGYPVEYFNPEGGSNVNNHDYTSCVGGRFPLLVPFLGEGLMDPQVRSLNGGVMSGSFRLPWMKGIWENSWSLCREGADCPVAPPLPEPEEFDPCARSGQVASQRDLCSAQLDLLFEALEPHFAEYNEFMKEAGENREAFDAALEWCELYDAAKDLLEAILTGGAGPAAEAARSLVYLRDLIEKAQEGKLGTLLYPAELKKALDAYNKVKAVWFELTADELEKMQRDLGACSGKVPIDTYLGAKKFLENLSAAKHLWDSQVAPGINALRTKGLQCAGWDHAAWRECIRDAECRGVPPDCGPEPSLEGAYD